MTHFALVFVWLRNALGNISFELSSQLWIQASIFISQNRLAHFDPQGNSCLLDGNHLEHGLPFYGEWVEHDLAIIKYNKK